MKIERLTRLLLTTKKGTLIEVERDMAGELYACGVHSITSQQQQQEAKRLYRLVDEAIRRINDHQTN